MQACGVALRCARQVSGAADVSHPFGRSYASRLVRTSVPWRDVQVPPRERDSFNVVTVGDSRKSRGEAGSAIGQASIAPRTGPEAPLDASLTLHHIMAGLITRWSAKGVNWLLPYRRSSERHGALPVLTAR
jgi:hypothetical protein